MSFPTTDTGLREAGYRFKSSATCKSCDAAIEFWDTPKGKLIPLDAGTLAAHWSTCPEADSFRDKPRNPKTDSFSAKDDGYRRPR